MTDPAKIQVRFSDLDTMGHVNNAVYLSYFEYARIHYFRHLLGIDWDWNENGILLVKNIVEYKKPLLLNDQPEIYIYLAAIGTKSFEFSYELKVNDEIYTTGSSVMVSFDSKKGRTTEISPEMRAALEKLPQKTQ